MADVEPFAQRDLVRLAPPTPADRVFRYLRRTVGFFQFFVVFSNQLANSLSPERRPLSSRLRLPACPAARSRDSALEQLCACSACRRLPQKAIMVGFFPRPWLYHLRVAPPGLRFTERLSPFCGAASSSLAEPILSCFFTFLLRSTRRDRGICFPKNRRAEGSLSSSYPSSVNVFSTPSVVSSCKGRSPYSSFPTHTPLSMRPTA